MVRTRKERKADNASVKLQQPDRSGPSEATLLDLAQERNLFDKADRKQAKNLRGQVGSDADDEDEEEEEDLAIPPAVDRIMEAILWSVCLAMLHFAFDVLVQRQFAMEISWPQIVTRSLQAWLGECCCYPSLSFQSPIPRKRLLLTGCLLAPTHPRQQLSFCYSMSSTTMPLRRHYSRVSLSDTRPPCARPYSSSRASTPAAT